jgi:hypothetical protein
MRRHWRLTANGDMDSWGDAPESARELGREWNLLAGLAAEPGSGIYEIAPGWYSSRPTIIAGPILDG